MKKGGPAVAEPPSPIGRNLRLIRRRRSAVARAVGAEVGEHQEDVTGGDGAIEVDVTGTLHVEHALSEFRVPHRADAAVGLGFGDEAFELVADAVTVGVVEALAVATKLGSKLSSVRPGSAAVGAGGSPARRCPRRRRVVVAGVICCPVVAASDQRAGLAAVPADDREGRGAGDGGHAVHEFSRIRRAGLGAVEVLLVAPSVDGELVLVGLRRAG